jgi:hypothetical protein
LAVITLDSSGEDVITSSGLYLLSEEEKRKKEDTELIKCFEEENKNEQFTLYLYV